MSLQLPKGPGIRIPSGTVTTIAALSHNNGPCNIYSGFMSGLPVVIKVLPKSMPHSKTEVQAFTKVRTHPYVARLLQVEEDVFSYYLIMERYATDLLEVLLSTDAAHDMTSVGTWFLHICQAVAYCHSQGVFHCDIKPENVLMSLDNVPHLSDFGSASLQRQCEPASLSRTYVPPEVHAALRGVPSGSRDNMFVSIDEAPQKRREVDAAASDVWSLGILLYVLCTGASPFVEVTNADPDFADLLAGRFVPRLPSPFSELFMFMAVPDAALRPSAAAVLQHAAWSRMDFGTLTPSLSDPSSRSSSDVPPRSWPSTPGYESATGGIDAQGRGSDSKPRSAPPSAPSSTDDAFNTTIASMCFSSSHVSLDSGYSTDSASSAAGSESFAAAFAAKLELGERSPVLLKAAGTFGGTPSLYEVRRKPSVTKRTRRSGSSAAPSSPNVPQLPASTTSHVSRVGRRRRPGAARSMAHNHTVPAISPMFEPDPASSPSPPAERNSKRYATDTSDMSSDSDTSTSTAGAVAFSRQLGLSLFVDTVTPGLGESLPFSHDLVGIDVSPMAATAPGRAAVSSGIVTPMSLRSRRKA